MSCAVFFRLRPCAKPRMFSLARLRFPTNPCQAAPLWQRRRGGRAPAGSAWVRVVGVVKSFQCSVLLHLLLRTAPAEEPVAPPPCCRKTAAGKPPPRAPLFQFRQRRTSPPPGAPLQETEPIPLRPSADPVPPGRASDARRRCSPRLRPQRVPCFLSCSSVARNHDGKACQQQQLPLRTPLLSTTPRRLTGPAGG